MSIPLTIPYWDISTYELSVRCVLDSLEILGQLQNKSGKQKALDLRTGTTACVATVKMGAIRSTLRSKRFKRVLASSLAEAKRGRTTPRAPAAAQPPSQKEMDDLPWQLGTCQDRAERAPPLPLRCLPIKGETPNSLLARLAERNGEPRPGALAKLIWDTYPNSTPSADELLGLADIAGLPLEAVSGTRPQLVGEKGWDANAKVQFMGQALRPLDFSSDRRACPKCMEGSPHERDIWTVRGITGCPSHNMRFIDSCRCGRKLDFNYSLSHCGCGARLAAVAPAEWTDADRAVSTYLEARLSGATHPAVPRLDCLDLSDAIALCARVGELHLGDRPVERYDALYGMGFTTLAGPRSELMSVVRRRAGWAWAKGEGRVGAGRLQPELPGLAKHELDAVAALVQEAAACGIRERVVFSPRRLHIEVQKYTVRRRSSLVPRPEYIAQMSPGQTGATVGQDAHV